MHYTKNYHLPQWEKSDRIMMDDFNAMCGNLEAGLEKTASDASKRSDQIQASADAAMAAANRAQQAAEGIPRQLLLTSVRVSMPKDRYGALVQGLAAAEQAGFGIEDFGDGSVLVREIPAILELDQLEGAVLELAELLHQNRTRLELDFFDELYHSIACKAAVKGNRFSQREEQQEPEKPKKPMEKLLREWIIPFGLEVLVLLFIIKFLFFFVVVPSGSMIPTIDTASILFATRVHQPENLQRGDIVVFDSDELGITLVKRLVGLPGDHVVLDENGRMTLNGEPVEEPYVFHKDSRTADFTVPEGHYLFLGDNRSGSNDARMWSQPYIPGEKISGHARFTLWPVENFGVLR